MWSVRVFIRCLLFLGSVSVPCKHFSNVILSQFLLILWSKEHFVFMGIGCALVWVLFCFIHDLSRDSERETNIFYNINIVPALCIWDIYVVFVETGIR